MERLGKMVIIGGAAIVVIGIIIWLLGDKLRFLGRLLGDIRIERENVRVYIPITTMILISVLLSAILWLIQKIIR
ncbi:MAG TPA: DUF2905 domain-containing protein [Flavipsychrobacter sp.]|nr:DUF2905 domain-containing protein [Flavipsychrobacter sp.]